MTIHLQGCSLGTGCTCGATRGPEVGKTVHYWTANTVGELEGPYATLVVAVDAETFEIGARIFFSTDEPMQVPRVPYSPSPRPGYWTWPAGG